MTRGPRPRIRGVARARRDRRLVRGARRRGARAQRVRHGGVGGRRRILRTSSRKRPPPGSSTSYDGDFTYFVGGGVAAFDCDDDATAGSVLRGRHRTPRRCTATRARSEGRSGSRRCRIPTTDLTRVVGAYPWTSTATIRSTWRSCGAARTCCCVAWATAASNAGTRHGASTAATTGRRRFSATWEGSATLPTLAFGNYLDLSRGRQDVTCADNVLVQTPAAGATLRRPDTAHARPGARSRSCSATGTDPVAATCG